MKTYEIVYLILFLVSVTMIYFAIKNYHNTKNLLANGIKTSAKVVSLIRVSGDDGDTFKPVFQYKNKQQKIIEFKGTVSSSPPAHKVGEKVVIVYSKRGKHQKVISFWGLYRFAVILLAIASPMFVISFSYLVYRFY